MKRSASYAGFFVTLIFFVVLVITYLYPETLSALNISPKVARTVLMDLISLILLLSFFQSHLTLSWRIFCLIASFIVMIESILMLGAWQQIIK